MKGAARTAAVVEDLVDYDGPQLLLLKTNQSRHMLATAVQHAPMREPFFSCEITEKTFDQYFDEKVDLHFAFRKAIRGIYYFFDLAECCDNSVDLKRASKVEVEDGSLWPEVGFFSRSHTTPFNKGSVSDSTKIFKIDGRWDASDFSHFHGKISDLYALFGVLKRLEGKDSAAEMGFVKHVIQERLWQGGGSYYGFYDSLVDRNRRLKLDRLEVARIQYASPGEIALRGDKNILAEVSEVIEIFDDKWDELRWRYRSIRGALKKERLLSAPPSASFSSEYMQNFIYESTLAFAVEMQIERLDAIFDACRNNVLVFSKLILSVFRRADELYRFLAEGRVQRTL
jgi:hypothetical protein